MKAGGRAMGTKVIAIDEKARERSSRFSFPVLVSSFHSQSSDKHSALQELTIKNSELGTENREL